MQGYIVFVSSFLYTISKLFALDQQPQNTYTPSGDRKNTFTASNIVKKLSVRLTLANKNLKFNVVFGALFTNF